MHIAICGYYMCVLLQLLCCCLQRSTLLPISTANTFYCELIASQKQQQQLHSLYGLFSSVQLAVIMVRQQWCYCRQVKVLAQPQWMRHICQPPSCSRLICVPLERHRAPFALTASGVTPSSASRCYLWIDRPAAYADRKLPTVLRI